MIIRKIKESDLNELIDLYAHYVDKENIPNLSELSVREIWNEIVKNQCVNYTVLKTGYGYCLTRSS